MEHPQVVLLFPLWYAVFLLSLTCHEAAHAFVAWRGGDPTAYHAGQVGLNPLPHVRREPLGTILVPLVTFFLAGGNWMMGWASAPYDPYWGDRHPRRAALMAAAGPAANLLLAGVAFTSLRAGLHAGLFGQPAVLDSFDRLVEPLSTTWGGVEGLGRLLSVLLFLNLVLFVFNLLPLPPLDGATVLASVFPPMARFQDFLRSSAFGSLIGLLVAWQVFPHLFGPIANWVIHRLFSG